ncbi:hypothetical protein [Ferruginibacter sp.]|nr:hypothetical protein [Ferruginibacter sp.]
MNKKKWTLLIVCIVLVFGYIKLFHKTYSNNAVAQSADCIVAIDVKRITNTIIWNIITTPSQWKAGNIFKRSSGTGEVSWKDMVKMPDYILTFHVNNQPANRWYVTLAIKDEKDFAKGLQQYHFEKLNSNEYASKDLGLQFFKTGNTILVTNAVDNNNYLAQVADELFIKKAYTAKEKLKKAIDAKSHVAVYISPNSFLQQAAIITANFDKQQITINCTISPNKQYNFTQHNFSYTDSSLCSLGFTQPSYAVINLLSAADKINISKAISFNIDSFFLQSNKNYSLDVAAIKPRTDSAITYSYDDNFNAVEKTVVNNILEPAYNFTVTGDSISNIYNYFLRSNKIEPTDTNQLFTAMPLVKSYCNIKSEKQLNITAANYTALPTDKNINAVFFLHLLLAKIPAALLKYFPDAVIKAIANIEQVQLQATKKEQQLVINCIIQKKKNDWPIIKL